jgi:16S rRNA (guanine527-N7)-methyltransferase
MEDAERRPAARASIVTLVREAARIGVAISGTAAARFQVYIDTLLLWRSRLSLTTAATPEAIVRMHIIDSLSVCRFIRPGMRVADLGSGAGFPGIPLAIMCDNARLALVESQRKKANFLREVIRRAQLTNAEVIEERAEHLAPASWDLVVSRAVWRLPGFLGVSERLLKKGGLAVAMKGPTGIAESRSDHGVLVPSEVVEYQLPSAAHHRLIVYRKP